MHIMSSPETEKSQQIKDFNVMLSTSLGLAMGILILVVFGWDSLQESARLVFHQSVSSLLEKEIDTKFFQMYPEYAEKLSEKKEIVMLAQGQTAPNNPEVMTVLETAMHISGGAIVFVMDSKGVVVGSSSTMQGRSILGNDYSFRPYFNQAIQGKSAAYPALGVTSNMRGIYFSTPIYSGSDHSPIGVVAVKASLSTIDDLLNQVTEPVALLSPDGIVFASNRKGWMYHAALPIEDETLERVRKSRQFSDQPLPHLQTQLNDKTVEVDGVDYSVRWLPIMIRGWQIGTLASLKVNYAIPTQQLIVFWGSIAFLVMLSVSTVVLMFNISKRKTVEEELRRAEEKYRSIFENAVEGIFRTSPTRQFIDANDSLSRILGFESKEELISNIHDIANQCFVNSDDFFNIEGKVEKEGQISGIEQRLVRKNGQKFWGSLSLRAVRGTSETRLFYEGTIIDISERKDKEKAERQKEIAELSAIAKDEFLANMSHEIRTPMNAILGLCHLMNTTQLSPKQLDYQKKIYRSANSLLRLIDDILDFSKIESGRLVIESVPFNFDEIFENLSVTATTGIGDSPIEFLYDISKDIPRELEGDPYRISQILTNLVSNAVKFTEKGRVVVRVSVKKISDAEFWLRFEVEDTGIGISPDKLTTLFDPFIQADSSTTRKYGGTGLGLSICEKLCTLMGGSIGVESDPGVGSLFHFELPLLHSKTGLISTDKPSFIAPAGQQPRIKHLQGKVLLVEDNEINQQVAKELLEQMGLVVDTVDDGEKAVGYVEQHSPDIVLMDIQMPVMDGYEATRRIRKLPGMSDLPIFAMTANALVGDADKSVQAGMDGHISKPVKPEELSRILIEHIQQSTQNQELATIKEEEKTSWIPPKDNPPGIDLHRGIIQVGGNPDLYFKLLRKIVSNHANCISDMIKMVKATKLEDARRVAHTMNGIAGTIGAYELQHFAAELEVCLASGEIPSQELLRHFSQTCENLLGTVQELISASQGSQSAQIIRSATRSRPRPGSHEDSMH
jgi:PAS domain S-box-containing protein